MQKVGLHITQTSAQNIEEQITAAIQTQQAQIETQENIEVTVYTYDREVRAMDNDVMTEVIFASKQVAEKVIGTGGDRIHTIKELYNVEINTKETGEASANSTSIDQPMTQANPAQL